MHIKFYNLFIILSVSVSLFIFFPKICLSQQSSSYSLNHNYPKLDSIIKYSNQDEFGSNFAIGLSTGYRIYTNHAKNQFLYGGAMDFNFSLNWIQKNIFLSLGFLIYKYKINDRDATGYGGSLNIYPSYAFSTKDRKYTFSGGIGYHFLGDNYFVSLFLIGAAGPFLSLKAQYNISSNSGFGVHLQTFKFKEGSNSQNAYKGYLLNNTIYYSIRF